MTLSLGSPRVVQDSLESVRKNTFFVEYDLRKARKNPSLRTLAPHQTAAIGKLQSWFASSARPRGGLMVLPTGGGKTFTAIRFLCQEPLSQGYKVLWLAHTHHLLEQSFFELGTRVGDESPQYAVGHIPERRETPRETLRVRVVSGTPGHFRVAEIKESDDFIIATLQTICKAFADTTRENGHPNLNQFLKSTDGRLCVVFDEAHHSPAPSYRRFIDALRQRYPELCLLGLTATPTYTDERKRGWLGKLFPQGILHEVSPADLQAAGILAKPIYEEPRTHVVPQFDDADYQKWLGTYQDIPEHIIKELAENQKRNELIANWYVQHQAQYGKTIIFADRWIQCEAICSLLRKRGIEADAVYSHIDASLPTVEERNRRTRDENAKVLAKFRAAKTGVLLNVRMLTEGTDLPDVQTVFLTRQTTSEILFTQMVGRALRGPKFGGTPEARIVCFIDDWKQMMNWAGFHEFQGGTSEEDDRRVEHPPLQLISIELVSRLARQMDSGQLIAELPFRSLIPIGWYKVEYQAQKAGSDEVEERRDMVLVFDSQKKSYEDLIRSLLVHIPAEYESENINLDSMRPALQGWQTDFFEDDGKQLGRDLQWNLFRIARHISQNGAAPAFFAFAERERHDVDSLYHRYRQMGLTEDAVDDQLWHEYENCDRFWRVWFPTFLKFRSQYDACRNRIKEAIRLGKNPANHTPDPAATRSENVADHEPTDAVKQSVKERDRWRCLCCTETRFLEIDHIDPRYHGGPNAIENLQTLCRICNQNRGTRGNTNQWNYRNNRTSLAGAPEFPALDWKKARPKDVRSTEEWERFLRRTINTYYRCAAIESVRIGKRGELFYRWEIRLFPGNPAAWIEPHLAGLASAIRSARQAGGVGGPDQISVVG